MLIFSTILLESSFFPHQILILSNFINISMNIFSFCEATRKNNLKNESPAAENCELEMFLSMNQIDFTHFLIRISNFVFQQLLLKFCFYKCSHISWKFQPLFRGAQKKYTSTRKSGCPNLRENQIA